MEREEREDCSRDGAGSEPAGDAPVHRSFESMCQRAAGLGYRRVEGSVPTAVVACTPNSRTRIGVISEPPPIPLSPTSMPTTKPDTTKSGLIAANRSMSSYAPGDEELLTTYMVLDLTPMAVTRLVRTAILPNGCGAMTNTIMSKPPSHNVKAT
jgi:hypothetical protein